MGFKLVEKGSWDRRAAYVAKANDAPYIRVHYGAKKGLLISLSAAALKALGKPSRALLAVGTDENADELAILPAGDDDDRAYKISQGTVARGRGGQFGMSRNKAPEWLTPGKHPVTFEDGALIVTAPEPVHEVTVAEINAKANGAHPPKIGPAWARLAAG